MKIGISTATLNNLYETEQAFDIIKNTGAECCEVYLRTFYEYRPEFAKKYACLAEGIEVNCVRVPHCNFERQLFSASRRVRGDGFYWLDQIMRSAQLFGTKYYTFNGGLDRVENSDLAAERLREIADFCLSYGVTLSLENSGSPYIFRELKSRCPQIAGAFNIGAARKECYPYQMYIENMSGAILHVLLSDADGDGASCLPGFGTSDFAEIFKRLKGAGFDGCVLINTPNVGDITNLKTSVEHLKELADKV